MEQLSFYLAQKLTARKNTDKNLTDVYRYGLEILLSSTLTSLSIIILSLFLNSFGYALLYFLITIPLRMAAGGYHADTHKKCFLLSNCTYIILSLAHSLLLHLELPSCIWFFPLYLSTAYILNKAPVPNIHQPLSDQLRKQNKKKTTFFLAFYCILFTFLLIAFPTLELTCFSILSILSVAILIIPTQKKGGKPQ